MVDSFIESARRHRTDARHLAADQRYQNGGHLIGFAAECLAKEVLTNAGIVIDRRSGFWKHFPLLGDRIRLDARTRAMVALIPILRSADFLAGWSANSRYEAAMPESDAETRYLDWRADVDALFHAVGVP